MRIEIRYIFVVIVLLVISLSTVQILRAEEETNIAQDPMMQPFELTVAKSNNYPVSLEDVLNISLENNLPLLIKEQQELIDKYDIMVSASEFLPSLGLTYSQGRFQGGVQIFGNQSFIIHRSQIEPRATVSYSLKSGGETIYKILAAKRKRKATEYSILDSKRLLLFEVSSTYYDLLNQYKHLEIALKEIEESKAILNLNNIRLENGLGTILEVSQSESQLALSKRNYIVADKNLLKLKQKLNYLLNLPLELNLIPVEADIKKVEIVNEREVSKLMNIAIDNRPDFLELKQRRKVFMAQRGMARSKFFPELSFSTYWGAQGPRFSDLIEQRSIGYGVNIDLLKNLGVNYLYNYKKSKPILKQSKMQIEQKWREIETEVANSLLEFEASEKQISVAKVGLKAAEDSFKYATERLKAGIGTNLDVLTAQVSLTTARTLLVDSIINFNKSQIALMNSIGNISINKILAKEPFINLNIEEVPENNDQ